MLRAKMFTSAAAVKTYEYVKNNGIKATINLKKEGENFLLIVMCTTLAFTIWFYTPALSSILLPFLVPLVLYFLYTTYNFLKNVYSKYYGKNNEIECDNKEALKITAMDHPSKAVQIIESFKQVDTLPDGITESVKDYLKNLAFSNPEKALELTNAVKIIESLLSKVSKSTKDKFFEPVMNLVTIDHQKAYSLATCIARTEKRLIKMEQPIRDKFQSLMLPPPNNIDDILNLAMSLEKICDSMKTVRQPTRDKFFNYVTTSACLTSGYYNSQEFLNLAYSIKEIDTAISDVTNIDLQNHIDKFFTIN